MGKVKEGFGGDNIKDKNYYSWIGMANEPNIKGGNMVDKELKLKKKIEDLKKEIRLLKLQIEIDDLEANLATLKNSRYGYWSPNTLPYIPEDIGR